MNPDQLLDQLSTHLKNSIARAIALASSLHHEAVTPTHLLSALLDESGGIGTEVLKKTPIQKEYIMTLLSTSPGLRDARAVSEPVQTMTLPGLNSLSKRALEKGMLLAYNTGNTYVGTEHLLYGLLGVDDPEIRYICNKFDIDRDQIFQEIETITQSTESFPRIDDLPEMNDRLDDVYDHDHDHAEERMMGHQPMHAPHTHQKNGPTPLELFTTDLTAKAIQQTIDPVIGRDQEIERVIHILCRRHKNNPILVGEPGVGKTAIVEGLAKRIFEGSVPSILKHKKILSLDLPLLIAGTIYRGEFEGRMKHIIDEVQKNPHIILFIDEIHTIVGAGSGQGTMDAANMLKPALARGVLHCIGATTIDEYQKHLASDPALERRLQKIVIEEPTPAETIDILHGVKKYYESFHTVGITADAVKAAVELSCTYIHDNFLPDKALDLLDEAAASIRATLPESPADTKIETTGQALQNAYEQKERAIQEERFGDAKTWKEKERKLAGTLATLKKKRVSKKPTRPTKRIGRKEVAQVLSRRLSIDSDLLLKTQTERLKSLETILSNTIIGQESAVQRIIETLRHSALGLGNTESPYASFLFTGPSGVGKTEMARILAQSLYPGTNALIRLDMSEFGEAFGTSKLLGSPAGYVGYKERNRFLDQVKKQPYAVILFDEIDKAHPDVMKLLLQILEQGILTDSTGKKIHFQHATIILTTNVGAELYRSGDIGFGQSKEQSAHTDRQNAILSKLRQTFDTALIGRINSVCLFRPLEPEHIRAIVKQHIAEINTLLTAKHRFSFTADEQSISALAETAHHHATGARNVEHTVRTVVTELLATAMKKKRKKTYTLKKENQSYTLV